MNQAATASSDRRANRGRAFASVLLLLVGGCAGTTPSRAFNQDKASAAVDQLLADHGRGVVASIWIGDGMSSFYERDADRPMPVASAIKSAFLIELFAEHAGALDQTSATFAKLTDDSSHPAFTHFSPAVQADIRRDLGQATVREVGRAMVRGTGVSNAVYNGAANLTTALLGGPAGLTKRIHARDPAFCDLMVRRYMLAARNEVDNEATARSLASVLQRVVTGKIEGIDNATLLAIQDILRGRDHPRFGHHLTKGGSLSSDPLTRVQSGAFPRNGHPLVYVIMLSQPDPADDSRTEAGHRLAALATALREALLK